MKQNIKIKPNKHETYYNMGNAYRKLKEYQKAIDAYKAAIKIKPDYPLALALKPRKCLGYKTPFEVFAKMT
jgi:cytochrome c-type biogenesis protein CcmH/NrfG